jgi:MFS family permease
LAVLLVTFSLFSVAGGAGTVLYADVFSKAIPARRRGRFTGWRQLLGYLAAIGAGWMVKEILEDESRWPFPDGYALIFLFSAISLLVAFVGFAMIKEPEYPAVRVSDSMRHLLRRAIGLAKKNANFRRFLWARGLTDMVLALGPFYVVYALNERAVNPAMIGVYLSVQMAGAALSNLVWGSLADRKGNRIVVLGTAVTGLLTPAAALLVPLHPGFFLLVFASMGATISGLRLGYSNLILEMADVELRPTCVALQNTLLAPVTLLPLVVGGLVAVVSFPALFVVGVGLMALALLVALRIIDPRTDPSGECIEESETVVPPI